MSRKIVREDWGTSIDLTCMIGRDRRNTDHLNRRRIAKRRRERLTRFLRRLWRCQEPELVPVIIQRRWR